MTVNNVLGLNKGALLNGISAEGGEFHLLDPLVGLFLIGLKFKPVFPVQPSRIANAAEGLEAAVFLFLNKFLEPLPYLSLRKPAPFQVPPLGRQNEELTGLNETGEVVLTLKSAHRFENSDGIRNNPNTGFIIRKTRTEKGDGKAEKVFPALVKLIKVPADGSGN